MSRVKEILLFLQAFSLIVGNSLLIRQGANDTESISFLKIVAADALRPAHLVDVDIVGPLPKIGRSGIIDDNARWPANRVVYEFDPNLPAAFKTTFMKAMNHITGRTCVIFKERMNENDYVLVTQGNDCSSSIGKRGGQQILSLGSQCGDFAIHVHLLIHVIGFGHEHNRADRDEYITINYANIDPVNHPNFDRYPGQAYSPFSVPYDYSSITHFGQKVQSANGLDTIVPKQIGAIIGEAKALSELDIKKINNMYCKGSLGMLIRNIYDGSYLDIKGGIGGEGKEVTLSKLKDIDSQKWTANWLDLMNHTKGATFASWAQDGGRLKVLDQDDSSNLVATWGYAAGYRNQLWVLDEVASSGTSIQRRYQIRNFGTGRCLSAPLVRCLGLNFFEFFFKRFVYNSCKGGQARAVTCRAEDERQLWNIDFA